MLTAETLQKDKMFAYLPIPAEKLGDGLENRDSESVCGLTYAQNSCIKFESP